MNNLIKSAVPLVLFGAMSAQADILGGSVEVSYWQASYSGGVDDGSSTIDLEDDLGFDDLGAVEIAATLEHPIPLLPNVRVKHIDLDETEDGALSVNFDGINFTSDVTTNFDLTHSDLMLYYEVLDNWVSLDIGLDVKVFDGQLVIEEEGTGETSTTDIDEVIPLPYVSAEFELPLTDLSFGAEVSGVKYSDSSMYDAKARFRQGISLAFIEIGYRQMAVDIEDISDIDVDIDLSGAYISTGIDF